MHDSTVKKTSNIAENFVDYVSNKIKSGNLKQAHELVKNLIEELDPPQRDALAMEYLESKLGNANTLDIMALRDSLDSLKSNPDNFLVKTLTQESLYKSINLDKPKDYSDKERVLSKLHIVEINEPITKLEVPLNDLYSDFGNRNLNKDIITEKREKLLTEKNAFSRDL